MKLPSRAYRFGYGQETGDLDFPYYITVSGRKRKSVVLYFCSFSMKPYIYLSRQKSPVIRYIEQVILITTEIKKKLDQGYRFMIISDSDE